MRYLLLLVTLCLFTHHASAETTIRVLTIGNSFAENACKNLKSIASDGDVSLVLGTANLGGCTLERHATLAKQSAADPDTKPYNYRSETGSTKLNLQEYLQAQPWDYVTLQQMSALSHQPETYHPHIDELVVLIRKLAPQAKILIHQTWAYRPDSPLLKNWAITQEEMQQRLVNAYSDVAQQFDAKVIPVGQAFHQVRSTPGREVVVPDPTSDYKTPSYPDLPDESHSLVVGWQWASRDGKPSLRLDFKHANASGCYLAGLVWYETITGNDARQIKFAPRGVDAEDAVFFREVAHRVVNHP
ncbi:DUF4886 domain-containing protein [Stieleria varia]|uniref:DUF4886 domain-containing protein n=1 Tax=Stieleria varia TaxID=2528005 RepID=A0A5C5ZPK0_9BACT|nr:DUF4886 domain-containing protein [Stieleria varia]TWT89442.1 hypothetical protein Pla52n_67810 [Stieleria varia]